MRAVCLSISFFSVSHSLSLSVWRDEARNEGKPHPGFGFYRLAKIHTGHVDRSRDGLPRSLTSDEHII